MSLGDTKGSTCYGGVYLSWGPAPLDWSWSLITQKGFLTLMLHAATGALLRAFASSALLCTLSLGRRVRRDNRGVPKWDEKLVPKPSPTVLHPQSVGRGF